MRRQLRLLDVVFHFQTRIFFFFPAFTFEERNCLELSTKASIKMQAKQSFFFSSNAIAESFGYNVTVIDDGLKIMNYKMKFTTVVGQTGV